MVYKVVSTKLTEEEHTKLLDECTKQGCTPSSLIKEAILNRIDSKNDPTETNKHGVTKEEEIDESELKKLLSKFSKNSSEPKQTSSSSPTRNQPMTCIYSTDKA